MNAEHILIKTLLGDREYHSVLYDVEPDMLPRGITTPGNIHLTVEKMTMFEEVFDAFAEELSAATAKVLARCDAEGTTEIALDHIPEAAHGLAQIAYSLAFGWAAMPAIVDAFRKDFIGHADLKKNLDQMPAYGSGDELQVSIGQQIAVLFTEQVKKHSGAITVTTDA